MKIIVTSLLTISVLAFVPSCRKDNCKATYIDENNKLRTEQLMENEEITPTQNIKC